MMFNSYVSDCRVELHRTNISFFGTYDSSIYEKFISDKEMVAKLK